MLDEFDSEKDLPSVRVYSLPPNNKLFLKRTDPYGFWHFSLERGALPDDFKGDYTSPTEAESSIQAYLEKRGKEAKPISP